jgi:hypothetical protein
MSKLLSHNEAPCRRPYACRDPQRAPWLSKVSLHSEAPSTRSFIPGDPECQFSTEAPSSQPRPPNRHLHSLQGSSCRPYTVKDCSGAPPTTCQHLTTALLALSQKCCASHTEAPTSCPVYGFALPAFAPCTRHCIVKTRKPLASGSLVTLPSFRERCSLVHVPFPAHTEAPLSRSLMCIFPPVKRRSALDASAPPLLHLESFTSHILTGRRSPLCLTPVELALSDLSVKPRPISQPRLACCPNGSRLSCRTHCRAFHREAPSIGRPHPVMCCSQ